MTTHSPSIVWFRRDLRLADQAALAAAVAMGGPVIPVFVLDDETAKHRRMGGASRWWLHHSLTALAHGLHARGSRLILRRGASETVLTKLAEETGAQTIHALHHVEPWWRNAEAAVAKRRDLRLQEGVYLSPVGSVVSGAGTPYKIYTPFWRALAQHMPPHDPMPAPRHIPAPAHWPASDRLGDWALLPTRPDWAGGIAGEWTPGEAGAHDRLEAFAGQRAAAYADGRNLPSREGSSRLSPHLHFGEISPAAVWHALARQHGDGAETFRGELGWRDYAANVVAQFPDYGAHPGRPEYADLPWRSGKTADADLKAWQQGRTGYAIVDAGMRQLWVSGWMHNRVRMIAASFLVKHLLIDWRQGEHWFWDTLVDADYGNNTVNWQWVAGSGIDANLFTRIMAPLVQSPKFDAGDYIRRWVPELAEVGDRDIHDPPETVRAKTGYPAPLVTHVAGRERALAAYRAMKAGAGAT